MVQTGTPIEARAAALKLAEKNGFDGKYDIYKKAIENLEKSNDKSAVDALNDLTKKKGRDLILAYKANNMKTDSKELHEELAGLSNSDFSSINFEKLVKHTGGQEGNGLVNIKKFFGRIKNDRKLQISRIISETNQEYLENNGILFEKKEEKKENEKREQEQEQKRKPVSGFGRPLS
jgi:hypothetical protein